MLKDQVTGKTKKQEAGKCIYCNSDKVAHRAFGIQICSRCYEVMDNEDELSKRIKWKEEQPVHYLKTVQPYFDDVLNGNKPFEVRFNDRNFQTGDELVLQEYDPATQSYTGHECTVQVTYLLDDPQYVKEGYVILGIV